ncbi:MAG: hypothetical protein V4529_17350 [Gemmatimonadota bacterium]
MSWIAGIDVDTKAVHCVCIDEDDATTPVYFQWTLDGQDAWERVRSVKESMPPKSFWEDTIAVGLENPAGRAGTGLYAVIRTTGAVLACLPSSVLVQPWRPGEWRKANRLKGNATKAEVKTFADALLRRSTPDDRPEWPCQDAADAYLIALATRGAIETEAAA